VTSNGLVVFQANVKVNTFSWSKIVKISFKRKQFFIQLRKESLETYDTLLGKHKETPSLQLLAQLYVLVGLLLFAFCF
jgi:hypothetical protein